MMNNVKTFLKSLLPHLGVFIFFFAIIFVYFFPVFEGKVIQQGDIDKFNGMAQEVIEYGKPSGWTGSMFSGMPSYHITGYSTGVDFIGDAKYYLFESFQGNSAGPMLFMLIFSYILFIVLGANILTAAGGAIMVAFSSYNPIIISAGHVTKAWALAYTPLVFAGMALVLKRKYLVGFILFAFGLALQIAANHLQITYYSTLFCGILFIGYMVSCIKDKKSGDLLKSLGVLTLGVIIAVGSNISNLYTNYELGQESTRGKTELTPKDTDSGPVSTGLDINYAFAWSYGKAETLTLLIPDALGGATGGYLDNDSHLYKEMKAKGAQVGSKIQTYTYWGDQPGTSGPVYFGAVVCFLFVLAFFVTSNKAKWWLLGATIFFVMLSWGRNLMWFNEFFFHHLPFYNKFRTVSMALVIPGFTFPILAVMAINEIIKGQLSKERLKKALIYTISVVGGICLIFWMMPGMFFDFQSPADESYGMPDWYLDALILDRKSLLQSDAFRSLVFVLLSAALVFWYIKAKDSKKTIIYIGIGFIVLVLCDLWQIDKRYLNDDNFITKKAHQEMVHKESVADKEILQDKSPSYRVLNLNNPFQETATSYYHKSIGGYHAAKLRRYQDLIDARLHPELNMIISTLSNNPTEASIMSTFQRCTSLNMLNAKYVIYNPGQAPLVNPFHYGNAWFVDSFRFVDSPDEEMAALETLNPLTEAVIDKRFADNLKSLQIVPDSTAKIELVTYAPDQLEYKSSSTKEGLAILSEVYYPYGWKAYIDGNQVPISRADWILRAIVIPAGDHQIKLVFDPDEVKVCGVINTILSGMLVLMLLACIVMYVYRKIK